MEVGECVVLRDLDTTLTSEAASALRDRIYRALHQETGTDGPNDPAP